MFGYTRRAIYKYSGGVTGGCGSAVRTSNGSATGGDHSVVRASPGGNYSEVRKSQGKAKCGDHSIAYGTEVEIGNGSVGVVVDDNGKIVKIVVNSDDEIPVEYGSTGVRSEDMVYLDGMKVSESTIREALKRYLD